MDASRPASVVMAPVRYAAVNLVDLVGHGYLARTSSATEGNVCLTHAVYWLLDQPILPWVKVRPSSRVAPTTTGTWRNAPWAMATRGSRGRTLVPRTGSVSPLAGASISAPSGVRRRQARLVPGSVQSTASASERPASSAADRLRLGQEPLWIMARWNSPRDPGDTRWTHTDQPPADSPPTVTCVGSPPNRAMLRRTQRSAACWSIRP